MSRGKPIGDENVLIGRNHWDVPVRVELRAYLRFGRRLDHQLHRLVLRWAHTAAPHSCASTVQPFQVHNKEC